MLLTLKLRKINKMIKKKRLAIQKSRNSKNTAEGSTDHE